MQVGLAVANLPGRVVCLEATFEGLRLPSLWFKSSFLEPSFDKGSHYSHHQVQELVARSSCRFQLLISYLTCLLNLYSQWREAYFHMSIWKYFTFMEPSVWFSKKRFEKQFSPVCLGRDQGLSTCLGSRKAVALIAPWPASEGNGCGILNWLTGLFAEWETLSCGNVKGISFSGMFLLCFHPTLPVL